MSYNLYKRFISLFPNAPRLSGVVISGGSTGQVLVQLPDGGIVNAVGVATVGQNVFIRDGVIEGVAPSLTEILIEI